MSAELSYVQLKIKNEARSSEDVKSEQRRRDLLILIYQYLQEEGYLDTVHAFNTEAGPSLLKYQVCDNVDLPTILQEYEEYYFVKFKRNPKITKRQATSGNVKKDLKKLPPIRKAGAVPRSMPDLNSALGPIASEACSAPEGSPVVRKTKDKTKKHTRSLLSQTPPVVDELGLSGSAIKEEPLCKSKDRARGGKKRMVDIRSVLDSAIQDATADALSQEDRLLKPIASFAGYNTEMRELASVISRDIYLQDPGVHWDDIIGLDGAKRLVKEAVVYPIKYPELFTGILSPWKGLLLYGPPGTGKTMLAKAVATECNTTFFNISASSIVSKWRGDSEKLIRVLFELARFHAPSTIFMDELDAIMGQRSGFGTAGGEHEGSRRMKTELLVQMDGLAKSSDLVFLLAASNLPWELDHAMLRRLEKRILVDLPSQEARNAMFRYHLPSTVSRPPVQITSQVEYEEVAEMTAGYSGSDIRLVCKEAAMQTVRQIFDKLEDVSEDKANLGSIHMSPIRTADVRTAVSKTKPSAKLYADRYLKWQTEFGSL